MSRLTGMADGKQRREYLSISVVGMPQKTHARSATLLVLLLATLRQTPNHPAHETSSEASCRHSPSRFWKETFGSVDGLNNVPPRTRK